MTHQPPMPRFPWRILSLIAAIVLAILVGRCAHAGNAKLTWTASTRYTNGDPITVPVTYRVFQNGTRIASGLSVLSYTVLGLAGPKSYCFTVKAVASNVASASSNKACKWVSA